MYSREDEACDTSRIEINISDCKVRKILLESEKKSEADKLKKRQCINKFLPKEEIKKAEERLNLIRDEVKNYRNEHIIGQKIIVEKMAKSQTIHPVLELMSETEVVIDDDNDEEELRMPDNPLDRFFCQKYLLGLLHFSQLYGKFFAIHDVAKFTQFFKEKIATRIRAMFPGVIEVYQYRVDPIYHVLTKNRNISCLELSKSKLVALQHLKPLVALFKQKATDERLIEALKRGQNDTRRRNGTGGINRLYKGNKKDIDLEKLITRSVNNENTDLSGFATISDLFQDYEDKEAAEQYNGETPEGKAKEFTDVAHSQRRLLQKLTPLDYRAYLLSNQTAMKIFPEKFRMQQLRMIETCHYDLDDEPRKLIGPFISSDALFPNRTNEQSETFGFFTNPTISVQEKPAVRYALSNPEEFNPVTASVTSSTKQQTSKSKVKFKVRNRHVSFEENNHSLKMKKCQATIDNIASSANALNAAWNGTKISSASLIKYPVDCASHSLATNCNTKPKFNVDTAIFNSMHSSGCHNPQQPKKFNSIIPDTALIHENNISTGSSLCGSDRGNNDYLTEIKHKTNGTSNNLLPTPGQSVLDFIMLQDLDFVKNNQSKNRLKNTQSGIGNGRLNAKKRTRTGIPISNGINNPVLTDDSTNGSNEAFTETERRLASLFGRFSSNSTSDVSSQHQTPSTCSVAELPTVSTNKKRQRKKPTLP